MFNRIFQMQTTTIMTDGGNLCGPVANPGCGAGGPSIIVGGQQPCFGGVTGFQNSMLCGPSYLGPGIAGGYNNGLAPGYAGPGIVGGYSNGLAPGYTGPGIVGGHNNGYGPGLNGPFGWGNNFNNGCGIAPLNMMLKLFSLMLTLMQEMSRMGRGGDCGYDPGYDDYAPRGRGGFDYDYDRPRGRFGDDYDFGPRGPFRRGPRGDYEDGNIEPFRPSPSFDGKASQIMNRLMRDLDLTPEQAAGIVGNLGAETGGFRHHQEINPRSGRGGLGWAQWTGPRRRAFEDYCAQRGLDTRSDEANYGFLVHELRTTERGALDAVRRSRTTEEAMYAFERHFERAGVKNYGARNRYAQQALQAFERYSYGIERA